MTVSYTHLDVYKRQAKTHSLKIKRATFDTVLAHFSPVSKELSDARRQLGEVDILFATDCISEGQNLQDCDCLVNYDIHWNPVRIIQRFGRIDRLGSCLLYTSKRRYA